MKEFRFAYIFCLIALGGMLISNLAAFKTSRSQAAGVVIPIPKVANNLSNRTIEFLNIWREITSLSAENEKLSQENLALKAQIEKLKEIEKENIELRSQLGTGATKTQEGTTIAKVVGLAPLGFFQTVTIDRGQDNDLKIGQPVVSLGFLVGTLAQVGPKTATVKLISAHNSFIPVILTKSQTKGLMRGGLKGLVAEDIPVDVQIEIGEEVVTAGLSETIPAGLAVGTVEEIISTKGEIFQVAKIKSPINFNQLGLVAVLK